MVPGTYPFIDIVVLDAIRRRFARGDALVVLSRDAERVIWINGAAASLFGFTGIGDMLGDATALPVQVRRQLASLRDLKPGATRPVSLRLAGGLKSGIVTFDASVMLLPGGEPATLLALASEGVSDERARASAAISGLSDDTTSVAVVDAKGAVLAASPGFERVAIDPAALVTLLQAAGIEPGRTIKRRVATAGGDVPTGVARLDEDPARFLLFAFGAQAPAEPEEKPVDRGSAPAMPEPADEGAGPAVAAAPSPGKARRGIETNGSVDRWYFHGDTDEGRLTEGLVRPAATARAPKEKTTEIMETDTSPAEEPAVAPDAADGDAAVPGSGPVRFIWKTDAEGRFTEVSPEFAAAVGPHAADVVGKSFDEVAERLGIDPDGVIAPLLAQRDTWSGRSVLWPLEGTALQAPVDLAALPAYSRDRLFIGFRGFGVVRPDEAVADPAATGLAIAAEAETGSRSTSPGTAVEPPQPPAPEEAGREGGERSSGDQTADAPQTPAGKDPFQGEKPVIYFAETPLRRSSDKVVRLEQRRRNGELSTSERNAFQEIADRLRREGIIVGTEETSEQPTPPPAENANRPPEPKTDTPEVEDAAAEAGTGPKSETSAHQSPEQTPADLDGEPETTPVETAADTAPPPSEDATATGTDATGAAPEEAESPAPGEPAPEPVEERAFHRPAGWLPSAFAPGARSRAKNGVETSILASLPVPVVIHSGDEIHYVNRAFLDLTGYESAGDLARSGGLDGLLSAERDADAAIAMNLARRDGSQCRVRAHLQAVPWEEGRALMLAVLPEAPTGAPPVQAPEQETAAAAARIEELTGILDTATDGVVVIGRDGEIRSVNHSAAALFGYEPGEVIGKPFSMLFAIESQRAAMDYLGGLSDGGVASLFNDGREVIGREAQGGFIPLFMTMGRLAASDGYCAVLRDITQWKRTEEELVGARREAERASSQKSEFLARISHEIRTPLNAIIGFAELMSDEKFGPIGNQRYRDYLRDIARSGNHVLDIVNDLLDLTKIEAGGLEMKFEAVPLNDALAEVVAIMQPQANRERVIIRSSLPSGLPDVVADLRSIKQIALNLLSNAVRFTGPGGQVIVSTGYETSGEVVMRVRDTGIGMTKAEIDEALKPFRQVNPVRRGRGDGTGLGLPLTKAMVEANRAVFSIESSPGSGTMVEITFPPTRVLAD